MQTSKSGDDSEETDEIGWDDDEGWGDDDDDDDDAWDEPVTVKTAVQVKHEAEHTVCIFSTCIYRPMLLCVKGLSIHVDCLVTSDTHA